MERLSNVVLVRYEELCNEPEACADKLIEFLPEIGSLAVDREYVAHNFKQKPLPIIDLNEEKIGKLSPSDIAAINTVFTPSESLLAWFGYELRS